VLPTQLAVPKAREAFDAGGSLVDPDLDRRARAVGAGLASTLAKLVG